jgi:hypothetical protein
MRTPQGGTKALNVGTGSSGASGSFQVSRLELSFSSFLPPGDGVAQRCHLSDMLLLSLCLMVSVWGPHGPVTAQSGHVASRAEGSAVASCPIFLTLSTALGGMQKQSDCAPTHGAQEPPEKPLDWGGWRGVGSEGAVL